MKANWMRHVTVVMVALAVVGCSPIGPDIKDAPPASNTTQQPQTKDTPRRGGSLILSHSADIAGLDPHLLPVGNYPMIPQIYNVLVAYDENLMPQAELAEGWEWNQEGKQLTLKLRKGVRFHSGREFTSADVEWNLKRVQDPKTAANIRPLSLAVKEILTPDAHTAVLVFDNPTPAAFDLLDGLFITDSQVGVELKQKGGGTGPFMLKRWVPGDHVELERNPNYWREGLPYLDQVILKVISDAPAMAVNLETGAIHVAENPSPQDYARWKDGDRIKLMQGAPGATFHDVAFNTMAGPFTNRLVRQAINMALNRQRFLEVVLNGFGETACLPYARNVLAFNAVQAGNCRFDLAEAKSLLAEAGYPNGFSTTIITSTGFPAHLKMAEMFAADLAKIGVTLKIVSMEPAAWRSALFEFKYEMAAHIYGRSNKDPDALFGTAVVWQTNPKGNPTQFDSDQFRDLVGQAGSTIDLNTRKELYHSINQILLDEAFTLPIASEARLWAMSPKVQGLAWNIDGMAILEQVWFLP